MNWFSEWFNEEYLELYPHRSQEEAVKQVRFLLEQKTSPAKRVLDIACGAGRHLVALKEQSIEAIGIDLSEALLQVARSADSSLKISRADMRRLPFSAGSFDLLISLFTSFGYFSSDEEHLALLRHWHELLHPGGELFIDYLNREHVISNLEPKTVHEISNKIVTQKRSLDKSSARIEKQIQIKDLSTGESRQYFESVRMYTVDELDDLLSEAGFRIEKRFGSFQGEPFQNDSERLLTFAMRANI